MAPTIHLHWISAPCRGVVMACRKAGINFEHKFVDLFKDEHKTPEFLKMNPEHCLPTVQDGDFTIWESHACATYLMDKYAPDSDLYPKDIQKRANVHKMLDQDSGIIYKVILPYVRPRALLGEETDPEEMEKMFQRLEDMVFKDKPFAAGDTFTIADIFILASITFTEITGYEFQYGRFPKLGAWLKTCKEAAWYVEANKEYEQLKEEMMKKK